MDDNDYLSIRIDLKDFVARGVSGRGVDTGGAEGGVGGGGGVGVGVGIRKGKFSSLSLDFTSIIESSVLGIIHRPDIHISIRLLMVHPGSPM